jgi:HAMP domain-containing protein
MRSMETKKRSLFRSLRGKIGLQMLVVAIAPLLLVGVIVYLSMSAAQFNAGESVDDSRVQLEQEVVGVNLEGVALGMAREVNQFMEERCGDISQWTKAPAVLAAAAYSTSNDSAVNGFLAQEMIFSTYFGELTLTNATGTMLNSVGATGVNDQALGVDQSTADWWQGAQNGTHIGTMTYVEGLSVYMLELAVGILDPQSGATVGVLKGTIYFPVDIAAQKYAERVPGGRVVMFDGEGSVISDTSDLTRHLQDAVTLTDLEQAVVDQVAQGEASGYEIGGGNVGGYAFTYFGEAQTFAALTGFTGVQWTVMAEQPEEVAFAPLDNLVALEDSTNNMVYTLAGVILAVALGALGMAFFLSRSITRPVTELRDVADKVSLGDLQVTVPKSSNDEIGDLAESFQRLVVSVRFLSEDDPDPAEG